MLEMYRDDVRRPLGSQAQAHTVEGEAPALMLYRSAGLMGAMRMLTSTSPYSSAGGRGSEMTSIASAGLPSLLQRTCRANTHAPSVSSAPLPRPAYSQHRTWYALILGSGLAS